MTLRHRLTQGLPHENMKIYTKSWNDALTVWSRMNQTDVIIEQDSLQFDGFTVFIGWQTAPVIARRTYTHIGCSKSSLRC